MRRHSRLGSPEHTHAVRAKEAERAMNSALQTAEAQLERRQCGNAYAAITQAWQGYGRVVAEDKGGGSAWIPYDDFKRVGGKFVDMCVRDLEHGLGRRRRRKSRR